MAQRTRYLVTYDIRDPRRLRRVHTVVKGYGDPLQYSVFVCDLDPIEILALKAALLAEITITEDAVSVFDLGAPQTRGVECIEFLGVRRPLPGQGAVVW